MGPLVLRLLIRYCDCLTMDARDRGYFGNPFKGHRGVTQGYPLCPTFCTVVEDVVLCHWISVVLKEEAVPWVSGRVVQRLKSYFYADIGLLVSMLAVIIQQAFNILKDLFDWGGL